MVRKQLDGRSTADETAKPDDVAVTLKEAVRLCLGAARKPASPALTATPAGVAVDAAWSVSSLTQHVDGAGATS